MPRLQVLLALVGATSLAACGSDSTNINQPSGGNTPPNTISIVPGAQTKGTAAFNPNPLSISLAANPAVTWSNDDQTNSGSYSSTGVSHNITADDGSSFISGVLAPGATFQTTFGTTGTFPYHCSIHPTMRGTVTVTP